MTRYLHGANTTQVSQGDLNTHTHAPLLVCQVDQTIHHQERRDAINTPSRPGEGKDAINLDRVDNFLGKLKRNLEVIAR